MHILKAYFTYALSFPTKVTIAIQSFDGVVFYCDIFFVEANFFHDTAYQTQEINKAPSLSSTHSTMYICNKIKPTYLFYILFYVLC